MNTHRFTIIGAGPAGLTSLINLLDLGLTHLAWIDPHFEAGRLGQRYREVPSNTKIGLFLDYVDQSETLKHILNQDLDEPNPYSILKSLDPNKGNRLDYFINFMIFITQQIINQYSARLQVYKASVKSIDLRNQEKWIINIKKKTDQINCIQTKQEEEEEEEDIEIESTCVVLATGCVPIQPKPTIIPTLDLDIALTPSQLKTSEIQSKLENKTIAVIGCSHSAMLVIINLIQNVSNVKIIHIFKSDIKFAKPMKDWILYDNTGLKDFVADWTRTEYLNHHQILKKLKISNEQQQQQQQIEQISKECDLMIYAIGFKPIQIDDQENYIRILIDGIQFNESIDLLFNHHLGNFNHLKIKHLFGCGIRFPEGVVDPFGNFELSIGIYKFMKFCKRVCKIWIKSLDKP